MRVRRGGVILFGSLLGLTLVARNTQACSCAGLLRSYVHEQLGSASRSLRAGSTQLSWRGIGHGESIDGQ
jgi:hypothetical protein